MTMASINGVVLHGSGESLASEELRQRACTELLRQAAQRAGLLDAADAATADGVVSEAAAGAIDALLEQELNLPEPSEEAVLTTSKGSFSCRTKYRIESLRKKLDSARSLMPM